MSSSNFCPCPWPMGLMERVVYGLATRNERRRWFHWNHQIDKRLAREDSHQRRLAVEASRIQAELARIDETTLTPTVGEVVAEPPLVAACCGPSWITFCTDEARVRVTFDE